VTEERANAVVAELLRRFGGEAEAEKVDGNGRYRFILLSPQFKQMTHLQRQDEIWKVIDQVLTRDENMDVSIVLTFAPGELDEWIEEMSGS
jgi:hypothetical protein